MRHTIEETAFRRRLAMAKKRWWKRALLVMATGTTMIFSYGGCLDVAIQRVLVAAAFD